MERGCRNAGREAVSRHHCERGGRPDGLLSRLWPQACRQGRGWFNASFEVGIAALVRCEGCGLRGGLLKKEGNDGRNHGPALENAACPL